MVLLVFISVVVVVVGVVWLFFNPVDSFIAENFTSGLPNIFQ